MESNLFLIVGLGNPGSEYSGTRHNIGFEVVDILSSRWNAPKWSKKFQAFLTEVDVNGRKIILLKPQTFMNLSGRSVAEIVHFFKLDFKSVLVITDDLDLPTGKLRIRLAGGSGGHNGLKSIIENLGTEDFPRIRVGLGRSSQGERTENWLLRKISKEERSQLDSAIQLAADAAEMSTQKGVQAAMNTFNQKEKVDGA